MNKKAIAVILFLFLIVAVALALPACNDNGGNNGETITEGSNGDNDGETITEGGNDGNGSVQISDGNNGGSNDKITKDYTFHGAVRNTVFKVYDGIKIYFGLLDNEVKEVALSNSNGEFSFTVNLPQDVSVDRLCDGISVKADTYDYRVFQTSQRADAGKINCDIVMEPKDSNISLYYGITDIMAKVTFNSNGVKLPAGYESKDIEYPNGGESINGETIIVGTKIYCGDILLGTINRYGVLEIVAIRIGSSIRFEKEGFTFYLRTSKQPFPALTNDTYTITGKEADMVEFRGSTDNLDLLIEG